MMDRRLIQGGGGGIEILCAIEIEIDTGACEPLKLKAENMCIKLSVMSVYKPTGSLV